MTSEQALERACCELGELSGWLSFKGFSRSGGADRIFFKKGHCFLVEFKTKKGKVRKNQMVEAKIMMSNGTPYHIVRDIEEFVQLLLEYKQ